jgi:hypothetical protein
MSASLPFVSRTQVFASSIHKFSAEASELGFAPGQWPKLMNTDIGNGQVFALAGFDEDGTAHYRQSAGCVSLVVFND